LLNTSKIRESTCPRINGRTIGIVRPNHFRFIVLFLLLGSPSTQAHLFPPLKGDDIKRISFVGRCEQNQWSTDKDDKLEIMMSAESGETCEARLHFREPQELKSLASLQFMVRSSRPKQRMAIELVGNADDDPEDSLARTRPFTVSDEWAPDALRFQRMKRGWRPKTISEIRFIAMSETGRSSPSLFIRDVRFAGISKNLSEAAAGAANATEGGTNEIASAVAADIPLERQLVCVAANDLASLQAQPPRTVPATLTAELKRLWEMLLTKAYFLSSTQRGIAGACLAWLAGAWWFIHRKKPSLVALVSPLYEINIRTWKSARDADGVPRLGGFNAVTLADLKSIKTSGFSSVWLMGIWDIGPKVRAISKRYGQDFLGSPFAIRDYRASEELGTEQEFDALVDRAHTAGLKVIVDFVPNHMGLDSDWLNRHPEYFIHRPLSPTEADLPDLELEKRYPGFFVHRTPSYPQGHRRVPKTILVAYGKDPYFYPWIDTAQLDYAEPGLRRLMTDVLCDMARRVDGVRCDMAMLVLREQIKVHRHPEMSWEAFNRMMPEEFWPEAIHAAKRVKPTFTFIAETYWAMEGYLQQLGFDYTYNKPLYEALCSAFQSANAEGLLNFMRLLGNDFLSRGVHFIENHDEERAMNTLGEERQRAAATVLCTLPGVALLHQGQMEGKRERLPVQRAIPVHQEPVNATLRGFYERLLKATAIPLFREGRLNVLYSNNPSLISYTRVDETAKAIVIINTSNQVQKGSVTLMPGLHLKTGTPYELHDLFYELKSPEQRRKSTVVPTYHYAAAHLITQGLYVELGPFDAHIFLVEPHPGFKLSERLVYAIRALNEGLPLPRVARRILGPVMMRSDDRPSDQI
jgi:glycosidase